jgi:outer membrane receptor protein involved in Fe transport
MKKLVVLLFALASITVQAQSIKGKVYVEKDKTPVQFASVGLVKLPDSTIVSGVITLTDGGYAFEKVKPGDYFVKVSYLGYGNGNKNVTVKEGSGDIVVDDILLTEVSKSLDEVTVIGERLQGNELVDRTVYAIPAQVAKTSANGYDILKKIPQVNVDFQNNVTLNGSTNFIIQVDGRQRDKEFLAKLLPEDIESIEIISNPSGKYEGNIDGVINIVLKKEARYGMNGNVGTYLKPINKTTAIVTGSLDYAMGKITFYATGFYFTQNLDVYSHNSNKFEFIDSLSNMDSKGDLKVSSTNINTGFDYYINDKNNLSFNLSYKPISQDIKTTGDGLLFSNFTNNANPEHKLVTNSIDKLNSDEYNTSVFYKKTFNKAIQELTLETNYYFFKSDAENGFSNTRNNNSTNDLINFYSRNENNDNEREYFSTKLNYVQPIGLTTKIEGGYQLYYQKMNYAFKIDNDPLSHPFNYQEYRNSVYAGLTTNFKKFGFQTMLRIENSHLKADSVTTPDYACVLPSANIQYKFSASHNIKFTYNRRINRPGIYDMNPYQKIAADYSLSQGNPDLKPEYRDRLQLTYTWNFGNNYFSPQVYYEFLSDKFGQRVLNVKSPIDTSFTTSKKPFNILNGYEYGGGINANLWFVNINARIFKGHYNQYTDQETFINARDYFSYSITSYAYAPLSKDKKTNAFVFLSYNGVSVDAQTKTYNMPFYGFGAQKQIKDHSIGFFYFMPLRTQIDFRKSETEFPGFNLKNTIGFDVSYYIQIMYSYKFSRGKNVKKLNRKVEVESDSKTEGIGR